MAQPLKGHPATNSVLTIPLTAVEEYSSLIVRDCNCSLKSQCSWIIQISQSFKKLNTQVRYGFPSCWLSSPGLLSEKISLELREHCDLLELPFSFLRCALSSSCMKSLLMLKSFKLRFAASIIPHIRQLNWKRTGRVVTVMTLELTKPERIIERH